MAEPTTAPATTDPDADLLEAFRRGAPEAFDALVRRHEARVWRIARRWLGDADAALDAAQEAFVRAWKGLPSFRGGSLFSTWLTRIAINQCRNELRRRRTVKHTRPLSLDAPARGSDQAPGDSVASRDPQPWEVARGREVEKAILSAIEDVEPESREVLLLRDVEDLSYEDIAEVLEIPVGTVRSRLHRAREEVRRHLGPVLEDRA